jgi:hypothetical protein
MTPSLISLARRSVGLALLVALSFGSVSGCGDEDGSPMTDAFAGSWIYGGALAPNCGAVPAEPVDLTGSSVVITKTGESSLQIVLGGTCTVNFSVSGSTASALPNQNCTFEVPSLGPQSVLITGWTLTLGGNSIASSFSGSVLICTITGDGTLTR